MRYSQVYGRTGARFVLDRNVRQVASRSVMVGTAISISQTIFDVAVNATAQVSPVISKQLSRACAVVVAGIVQVVRSGRVLAGTTTQAASIISKQLSRSRSMVASGVAQVRRSVAVSMGSLSSLVAWITKSIFIK